MGEYSGYIQALTNGFQAGLDGKDPRLCPYEKMSLEWNVWQRWHGFGTKRAAGENVSNPLRTSVGIEWDKPPTDLTRRQIVIIVVTELVCGIVIGFGIGAAVMALHFHH